MIDCTSALWTDLLKHVRTHHPALARGWFTQLNPGALHNGVLTVVASNDAQLAYLQKLCGRPFNDAAIAATGHLVTVVFRGASGIDGQTALDALPANWTLPKLSGDYTFNNFVVGRCNRLAHSCCLAVSESPGTVYNPLFVYGSVGLGKTHLLQAICHQVLEHSPTATIGYLTCENFVNHYVEAMSKQAVDEFRHRYREVDLLVVDDIQFLAGKPQTQEEFFHTFNTLFQSHKQIILSADCAPSEIADLEERITSRFKCGLVARIDPPCMETRLAIIQNKMRARGAALSEEVVMYLASKIKSNARELEGALNRLHGFAAAENAPIDLDLAKRSLGEDSPTASRAVRIQEILGVVTDRFDVKLSDLQSKRKSRSIALPRQVCMYLARRFTQQSLQEIGRAFGGRDHTTVMHANKLISEKREKDPKFCDELDQIEHALQHA